MIAWLFLIVLDNIQEGGPAARANVNETHEVRYWTQKFNCSAEQLRAVVAKVSIMADDVERELTASLA